MGDEFWKDQTILIVGAGRPPGPALVQAFARQGANVAANELSPTLLDPILNALQGFPGRVKVYVGDATRGMPLRAMLDEVQEDWGKIDVLINNPRIQPEVDLLEMDEWDWQRTIEMNLNGPFLVSKLVAQSMREQGHGVILNIVDTSPGVPEKGRAAYSASQSGLLAFSQAAEREFLTYNIQVYTLCPDREILHQAPRLDTSPQYPNETGQEESLAQLAVMLCSPKASNLTDNRTYFISRTGYYPQTGVSAKE